MIRTALCCFLLLFSQSAFSQDKAELNTNPLNAEARIIPAKLAPGGTAELIIDLNLDPPFIAYEDQFKVKLSEEIQGITGTLNITPLVEFKDVVSKKMKKGLKGKGQIKTILETSMDNKLREGGKVLLRYQACTVKFCLFPKTIELDLKYEIANVDTFFNSNSSGLVKAHKVDSTQLDSRFAKALGEGYLSLFFLAFLFGLLTAFTPCIYPMIPITLAVLGTNSSEPSPLKGFTLSIFYVLGIALTYTALGIIAALTGAMFGGLLGNIWAVSVIALIFIAMGFSMLGFFEIKIPDRLSQKLNQQKKGNFLVAFFSGLVAGIVASPCVGPVLLSILTFISQTQNVVLGGSLLFTFALGLGSLFILLGTFSGLISKLPRSGAWMESVKILFGGIMFAMAFYFTKPVYPETLWYVLAGLSSIAFASVYGAFDPIKGKSLIPKLRKGFMISLLAFGIAVATKPLWGSSFSNQSPGDISDNGYDPNGIHWQVYSDKLLKQAKGQAKPVMIDFYADWCAVCVQMLGSTFKDPKVIELSRSFVMIKVDNTKPNPLADQALKDFGVLSLPTFIFISPKGEVKKELTLREFEGSKEFIDRMKTALRP